MTKELITYLENKNYTEFEIETTALYMDMGIDLPEEVKQDIREYWRTKQWKN